MIQVGTARQYFTLDEWGWYRSFRTLSYTIFHSIEWIIWACKVWLHHLQHAFLKQKMSNTPGTYNTILCKIFISSEWHQKTRVDTKSGIKYQEYNYNHHTIILCSIKLHYIVYYIVNSFNQGCLYTLNTSYKCRAYSSKVSYRFTTVKWLSR